MSAAEGCRETSASPKIVQGVLARIRQRTVGDLPTQPAELPPDLAPSEMVAEGRLRRLFPDEPTHPNQAYAAPLGNDKGAT